ncbi:MAG: hypothetical protein M1453_08515 [Acidobacteria bacterium]|nr:hypothetical protein [Acidobacteriota bacterium]MCL5288018.1 hypothetical protein [Acidobacteriota bacterium]
MMACNAGHAETAKWKVFSNRAGWSIGYPADWKVASCKNCPDPTDPDVYVDFFPPTDKQSDEGWVMVVHLVDKPPGMSADQWFADIKQTANLNPRINEQRLTLNDLPALKVRYRNSSGGGLEMEAVYVLSGSKTFAINFSGNKPGIALDSLRNYPIYVRMLSSFKIKA